MNEIMKEMRSIPDLVEKEYWKLEEEIRLLVPTKRILDLKNIYIVGSGDSYMSGLATEMAFLTRTNLYTRAFKSLDFSRYFLPLHRDEPTKNSLVISISNSGSAARVIEAQRRAKSQLYLTLSITSNKESTLAKESDYVIETNIEKISDGSVPGVRSFIITQIALYLLSIRIGELKANYTMDDAQSMRREMFEILVKEYKTLETSLFKEFVSQINLHEQVEVLGSGPLMGVAEYFAATTVEAVGFNPTVTDIEEFGHVNFFKKYPEKIPTLIFAAKESKSRSRILEIIESVKSLGRPFLIITNEDDTYNLKYPDNTLLINNDFPEIESPLVFSIITASMVSMLGDVENPDYFRNHAGVYDESKLVRPSESKIE